MKLFSSCKVKKIIIITSVSVATAMLVISLIAFILIQSYINKMNLVAIDNNDSVNIIPNAEADIIEDDLSSLNKNNQVLDTEDYDILEDEEATAFTDDLQKDIDLVEERIRANMEEAKTPIMEDKDVQNILLIGSDTRVTGEKGRSDAMIIISLNEKTKSITATSIMRDIYLHIPGKGNNRINAAYAFGGADLLMDTIKQNLKIEVNRYVSIDFYAFIDVINELGGVNIEVSEKEMSIINNSVNNMNILTGEEGQHQLLEPGLHLLNGKQALEYARIRKVGNSDFERTARQRRVLEQVFDGIKDLDLIELNDLANVILPQVTTNLTKGEIFSLILGLPSYRNYDLQELRIPIDGSYTNMRIKGMAVLNIDFNKNINEIRYKIYQENKE
ncbi:MAG: LytR family transcriptional regulator [Anaerolineaceae bacterium]|nr:MAG: LytR family transcriptional regulator [Anaerolineaceae bacterium]